MKIAVISPGTFCPKLKKIEEEFSSIEFIYLTYEAYEDVADIVKQEQAKFDGLLFSGLISYYIAKEYLTGEILYEILPRFEGEVMAALLQAGIQGYDIQRVSFDTYSRALIKEAYWEVGIDKPEEEIIGMREAYDDYQSNQMIYQFHRQSVAAGKADICVTTHNEVFELLKKEGIPCIKSERTFDTIRSSVRRLQMRYMEKYSVPKEIAVLCLQIYLKEMDANNTYTEYQHTLDKMRVMEQIYLFAQRVQGAVVEGNNGNVYLFTTKKMMTEVTKHYTCFTFLEQLKHKVYHRVSVGIGYGSTMFEAKANAIQGMMRSREYDHSVIFLVYSPSRIVGPLEASEDTIAKDLLIEEKLSEVSAKSGVPMKHLNRMKVVMENHKKNTFTSKEMAQYCDLSVRNMDRMIEKLMDSGFACISGMRTRGEGGRPSRIIIFYF